MAKLLAISAVIIFTLASAHEHQLKLQTERTVSVGANARSNHVEQRMMRRSATCPECDNLAQSECQAKDGCSWTSGNSGSCGQSAADCQSARTASNIMGTSSSDSFAEEDIEDQEEGAEEGEETEVGAAKKVFSHFDANANGFLERNEIASLWTDFGLDQSVDWKAFDQDHDGQWSPQEFVAAGAIVEAKHGFDAADTDGSSFLEEDEINALLDGKDDTEPDAANKWRRFDKDGDGRLSMGEALPRFKTGLAIHQESILGGSQNADSGRLDSVLAKDSVYIAQASLKEKQAESNVEEAKQAGRLALLSQREQADIKKMEAAADKKADEAGQAIKAAEQVKLEKMDARFDEIKQKAKDDAQEYLLQQEKLQREKTAKAMAKLEKHKETANRAQDQIDAQIAQNEHFVKELPHIDPIPAIAQEAESPMALMELAHDCGDTTTEDACDSNSSCQWHTDGSCRTKTTTAAPSR